jgi:predicted O-linked N-acetylglucosamine transferase (SPINDLY family)
MDPVTGALAAMRLAPLQITSWGHPVTSGLPTIDWFLSAELLEAPDADGHYREKLVRLPGNGVYTAPVACRKEPWAGPARRPGTVRFALCQQPIKFDPRDDELLVRIARSVGDAEFWLAAPANMPWTAHKLRERLAAAFAADGLDPDAFLRTTPWLARGQFLGFLDQMDICLDAPAFSGYTTAWQAVQAGLPIVTLEGRFLRQRLASGLLRRIGEIDAVAQSREQYVELAVHWAREARDADRWAARRARLRRAAPLADGNRDAIVQFEQRIRTALR